MLSRGPETSCYSRKPTRRSRSYGTTPVRDKVASYLLRLRYPCLVSANARSSVLESQNSMQRAGEFLGRVVRRLERPEAALAWLAGSWPSVVGKALAAHTRPVRCAAGRLEIAADRRAWQKQLEEMKREICARVNQAWGGDLVHEVKLVATEPDSNRVPPEDNNEHTPFVRRNRDSDT